MTTKIGRNDPCHCGSGQKYKKCCLAKDDAARSAELATLAAKAEEAAKAAQAAAEEAEASDVQANANRPTAAKSRGAEGGAVKPKTSAARPPPAIRRKAV